MFEVGQKGGIWIGSLGLGGYFMIQDRDSGRGSFSLACESTAGHCMLVKVEMRVKHKHEDLPTRSTIDILGQQRIYVASIDIKAYPHFYSADYLVHVVYWEDKMGKSLVKSVWCRSQTVWRSKNEKGISPPIKIRHPVKGQFVGLANCDLRSGSSVHGCQLCQQASLSAAPLYHPVLSFNQHWHRCSTCGLLSSTSPPLWPP